MKNRRDRYSQQKYIKRNRVLKDENCFQRILQKSTDGKQSNINEAEVKLIFIGTGTHKTSNCLYNIAAIYIFYLFLYFKITHQDFSVSDGKILPWD